MLTNIKMPQIPRSSFSPSDAGKSVQFPFFQTRSQRQTMSPVDAPVFKDHLMEHDLPIPTTEHASTPPRPHVREGNSIGALVKEESTEFKEDIILSPVSTSTPPARKERIFFFKKITDGIPHIDVLFQVGEGELLPGTPQYEIENGLREASDGLFIFRQTGPQFKVLQSAISAMFEEKGASRAAIREHISLKTAAFVGNRDAHGELHILKFTMSGNFFQSPTGQNTDMVMHHGKWKNRVKKLARVLGLNMRTLYDGAGRKATPEDYGNWAAGHCEKKLSTFIVYALLRMFGFRAEDLTKEDLDLLKNTLSAHGLRPRFEIHLTRAPCGSARKPGCCIQFVHRLAYATGIDFTINQWEDNVILDGTVPPRPLAKGANLDIVAEIERQRAMLNDDEDEVEDDEAADFDFYLASQYEDNWRGIVFDGFDPAQDKPAPARQPSPASNISPEARQNFAKTIQCKFGRKKSPPDIVRQRRAANTKKAEDQARRKKKLEKRPRKNAAAAAADRDAAGRDVELEAVAVRDIQTHPTRTTHQTLGKSTITSTTKTGCRLTQCWDRGVCYCLSAGGVKALHSAAWLMKL